MNFKKTHNKSFDDGRGDSPRFLTAYYPPRPSIQTLGFKIDINHFSNEKKIMLHINAKIAIGILSSFILSGLMYFIGKDTIDSLMIGMLGTIFTILYSIKEDINNSSTLILASIQTSKDINSSPLLKKLITTSVNDHNEINKFKNEILSTESIDALRIYSTTLSDLAKKKINAKTEDKRVQIMMSLIKETKKYIHTVSYANLWKEELGRKLFKENEILIKRGVKIKRIFVLNNIDNITFDIIKNHLSIGVDCYTIPEGSLPNDIKIHQTIYDDFAVTFPQYNKAGYNSGGVISFDEKDISQAKDAWDRLKLFATKINDQSELVAQ